jgi:hypothetical protein
VNLQTLLEVAELTKDKNMKKILITLTPQKLEKLNEIMEMEGETFQSPYIASLIIKYHNILTGKVIINATKQK